MTNLEEIIEIIKKRGYPEESQKREISLYAHQSEERLGFVLKQLKCFDGWMQGSMFMPSDGKCYHCKRDVLEYEVSNGNDGSKGVTGCFNCHRSYCD